VNDGAGVVDILVADESAASLLSSDVQRWLPGVRLLHADTEESAWALLQAHEPAAALIDLDLPGRGGPALAERMRADDRLRHVPIVFATPEKHLPRPAERVAGASVVDYVARPLDPNVLAGKLAVFVDLHRQRLRLQEHIAEVQRLRKLNEMMTAMLTHDLRTPLMAISLSAEIVHRRGTEDAVQKAGQRIKASSSRIARLADHLLNFARVRSGMVRIAPRPADLGSACAAAVADIVEVHPGVRIDVQPEGDLKGVFDEDCMTQVFANLIGYMVEHLDAGAPVRLRLGGDRADRFSVEIASSGVFSDEVQGQIFEPVRGRSLNQSAPDPEPSGLGSGLYLVDRFISAHGGSIVGRSNEAEGTVFEFLLPRSTPADA
jgi:signal transduction histidine kinase